MYQLKIISNVKRRIGVGVLAILLLNSPSELAADKLDGSDGSWLTLLDQGAMSLPLQIVGVDDLVQVLLANNLQLQSVYSTWKMRSAEVGTVVTLPDPTLSMGYFLEPVETAQGPQKVKLSLGQRIPWFAKTKAALQIKQAQADRAYAALNHTRISLIRELRTLWEEAGFLQMSAVLVEQKIAHSRDLEVVLRTQYTSASISHKHYAEVQIQTLLLDDQLQNLKDQLYRLRVDLGSLFDLKVPFPASLLPQTISDFKEPVGNEKQFNEHPRLLQLDMQQQEAEARSTLARADYYPDLRIGLDYLFTDQKMVDGVAVTESGRDPLAISVGIALPLWNWNKKRLAVTASNWQRDRVEKQREYAATLLLRELEITRSKLLEDFRQISLYEESLIPKSREIVHVMEQAYISQSVDIVTLTEARQKLLDLQLKLVKTHHSAQVQNVILTYLKGE